MADLHIDWMKPIRLPKEGKHSLAIDTDSIPKAPGVYMFFRRVGTNSTEVVYVGKAANLKGRTTGHQNNHALITALLETEGTYYLMPGRFKPLPGQNSKTSIRTIERVIIRTCIEDGHPLINIAGARIKTQHVVSTLPAGSKFLSEKIGFEPVAHKKKGAAKKAGTKRKPAAGK